MSPMPSVSGAQVAPAASVSQAPKKGVVTGRDLNRAVLVVDDDPDIREALQDILESEMYQVETAGNGQDALDRARHHRPRVILLDLMMPVMDGAEFRRRQLADPQLSSIPVIVVSAISALDQEARRLAITEHLQKPLEIDELLAVVARHCQ